MKESTKTFFVVTIDTEEDNWGQHRNDLSCENIREIPKLQELFEKFGILPTYLVSYQVCQHDWAIDILKTYQDRGTCEIGAHLHPWNTPPEDEEMTAYNSFLKNLPFELQLEKMQVLTQKIEEVFGMRPKCFRTGRWGLGKETIDALIACDYKIDSSVTPTLSWEIEGGPIYNQTETDPYIIFGTNTKENGLILELPASIGFNRWPFPFWKRVYETAELNTFKPLHLIGILNRTSLLQKIWLTPEGYPVEKMIALAKVLLEKRKQLLNLSFHSNALLPGLTPFVKTKDDVQLFYQKLEKFFIFLKNEKNVSPATLYQAGNSCQVSNKPRSLF